MKRVERKEITKIEELNTNDVRIIEAFKLVADSKKMTKEVQNKLCGLGFTLVFRGFNSHSKDCFIYNGKVSFGIANLNQAGRGYELEL